VARIRFIASHDPNESYVSEEAEFLIGRSEDCLVQIHDPEVSRHQAQVTFKDGRYAIENLGLNPVKINGQPVKESFLEDGDRILTGGAEFLIRIEDGEGGKEPIPRLVLDAESGKSLEFPIHKDRMVIGRSPEADVHLEDKTISRSHCVIAKEKNEYVAIKLSDLNPVIVNDEDVDRKRLFSGDTLRVGPFSLRFVSDRPEDAAEEVDDRTILSAEVITQELGPRLVLETQSGQTESYSLDKDRTVIGRSAEADIRLDDHRISRTHCAVEIEADEYIAVNLSESNPLLVNSENISRHRLYSGDQIQVGPYSLIFISTREEDFRAFEEDKTVLMTEPLQQELGPRLVLETLSGQTQLYPLTKDRLTIGRSPETDIHVDDLSVSREHGAVEKEADGYVAVNLSHSNPLKVNNETVTRRKLHAGDQIRVGPFVLHFFSDEVEDTQPEEEDRTIFMAEPIHHEIGPRLVIETESGETQTFHLNKDRMTIGRATEADIHLDDHTVSRTHCAIEKGRDGYEAVNLSRHSAVFVNTEEIDRTRLYSGDQIKIGANVLSFMSDRPEDTRPVEQTVVVKKQGPSIAVLGTLFCLLMILGGYTIYKQVYTPWKTGNILKTASQEFSSGSYENGREIIEDLLKEDISTERVREAKKLLADSAMKQVRQISKTGHLKEAKQFLVSYLKEYGAGKEASLLWDELDHLRYTIGQESEDEGRPHEAIREYSVIRADSLFYLKAQKAISRIWLARQQQRLAEQQNRQTVEKLLQKAESSFTAKQYLTPLNDNAYSTYRAVLAIEPNNSIAQERIDAIKSYYRKRGIDFFNKKKWDRALENFESYALIDPENPDIKNKITICKKNLSESRAVAEKSARKKEAVARDLANEQQRIAEQQKSQTVAKLLQKAESNYNAKRYLTPMNNNAYSMYQAVLAIDPGNSIALERIGAMKSYFQNQGNLDFEKKAWQQALANFESYALMDPDDAKVREKIRICQNNLAGSKPQKALQAEGKTTAKQQERVKRMLEESGTESTWIMKYLFEEEKQGGSETPW